MDGHNLEKQLPKILIKGDLKEVEQQILEFFMSIAEKSNLNLNLSKIFGYFRIYDSLTQKQLKELSGISLSTISASLKSLTKSSILAREFIPKTHTNIYTLNKNHPFFAYSPNDVIYRSLEQHDYYILDLQDELRKYKNKFPTEVTFFIKRLNSLRNYIEARRRAFLGKKSNNYLDENAFDFFPKNGFMIYPEEIESLETKLVERFVRMEMFVSEDPIINKILTYLITRMKLNQEMLEKLTSFSRSTISRNLSTYREQEYVVITAKQYLKPRIYFIDSIGVYLNDVVLMIDKSIISWKPKFKHLLEELQNNPTYKKDEAMNNMLQNKISELIADISKLDSRSARLQQAQNDLMDFLKKN